LGLNLGGEENTARCPIILDVRRTQKPFKEEKRKSGQNLVIRLWGNPRFEGVEAPATQAKQRGKKIGQLKKGQE